MLPLNFCHFSKIHKIITIISALYFHALLPADPQVSAGQETGHGVTRQVMDPALLTQLGHDGVDPGETRLGLRRNVMLMLHTKPRIKTLNARFSYGSPFLQRLRIMVPVDLQTDRVSLHLGEVWRP